MVNGVLGRKVLREIKNNFKTYISVIIIAALAVTLFTGIWANYKNFDEKLDYIYEQSNMCDGIVMSKTYNQNIEQYLTDNNVFYEKRIYFSTKIGNNSAYIVVFGDNMTLNRPFTMSVSSLNDDMVLIDEGYMERKAIKENDLINVELPINDLTIQLSVNGSMTHPESLENSSYNPAFVYVGYNAFVKAIVAAINNPYIGEDLVKGVLANYYNQYLIKGDSAIFEKINDIFKNEDNYIYSLKRSDLPSNMTVDADVNQAKQLIYIFPVIFYLVAILIILTSISQLINRESKNIGILKALGYSKLEILFHYMQIFIVLGIIGSIFGLVLGPTIVPNVMGKKYGVLYQLPNISLPFFRWEYLISVALLIAIVALVSLFACFEAMNKVPASSLRGDNSVNMKVSFLDKFKIFKKIPLSLLMAFRNMKRKISRTLMVVVGVMGCSALLVCGFGIEDTINYGLDLELTELIPYDLSLSYSSYESKKELIMNVEGVTAVDEYAKLNVNIKSKNIISSNLFILSDELSIFKTAVNEETCLISTKVAEEIGCSEGDEISFIYNNNNYYLKVTKIVDFCMSQGIFISNKRFSDIDFKPSGAWVGTNIENNDDIAIKLEELLGILDATTMAETRIRAENVISSIKVMTWTIKIFAILLAVVVLYNLALLNFKERTKDIATLKVLGFSKFEVASSFIIEILTLTFVGAIVGLFLGYPLLVAVLSINENPLLSYIYHIDFISYILTILITCGSSLLINMFFAFLTNKVLMVESLKSVE